MDDLASRLEELGEFESGDGWASFRGIGKDPEHPLYRYWAAVMVRAVFPLTPEQAPEGWYDLTTRVYIKHESPGWIDGFRVSTG